MTLLVKKSEIDLVGIDNDFEKAAEFFGLKESYCKYRRTSGSDYEALRWTLKASRKNFVVSKGHGLLGQGLLITELEVFEGREGF